MSYVESLIKVFLLGCPPPHWKAEARGLLPNVQVQPQAEGWPRIHTWGDQGDFKRLLEQIFLDFLVQIIFYQAAGLSKKFARTIGIAVDHRRRYEMFKFSLNCWWRQFKNMRTSETRMWSLCSWTHRGWKSSSRRWSWTGQAKPRKGDATAEEMSKAVQLAGTKVKL